MDAATHFKLHHILEIAMGVNGLTRCDSNEQGNHSYERSFRDVHPLYPRYRLS
jgi:hypothetical protein